MNANIGKERRPAGPLRGKFTRERWYRMLARLNGGEVDSHTLTLRAGIAETRTRLQRMGELLSPTPKYRCPAPDCAGVHPSSREFCR